MSTEPGSFTSNGSMIVVSNRLPFVLKRNEVTGKLERKASAGGLVTAVAPVVISGNGVWVGWPGMHMDNPNEPIPESDPNDRTPTAGLLSRKENDTGRKRNWQRRRSYSGGGVYVSMITMLWWFP